MGIDAGNALGRERERATVGPSQGVNECVPVGMTSFNEEGYTIAAGKFERFRWALGPAQRFSSEQDGCLIEVRRDDRRERQEFKSNRGDGFGGEQYRAARGHHDWIDDGGNLRFRDETRDRFDNLDIQQHPCFQGFGTIVTGNLAALLEDKSWAGRLDAGDAERILGREASDGGGAIDPVGGEGQKVGLDACTRAAIGAGDGQRDGEVRQGCGHGGVGLDLDLI